ncbi:MAG: peptidoglycan DD-metalloendopeptidase family protein, partial [Flavobacteriaceae bacterium]|nr:peptidoglycan DD-metalloendopeptidase family protein [Flavobacteriaceae bacterium]
DLLASTRKEIKSYQNQLANIEREIKSTEREIERLVREALAASNKNTSNKSSSSFTLTPEGKALAKSFEQNKGKLPWPVERGYLKIGYGEHPSDLDPKLKIFSNGYRIVTGADQEARAVFRGTVFKILGANKSGRGVSVMLQHGDYFTVYSNLSAIYVKVGDAVENKQAIGKIMPSENNTAELRFSIYRNPKFIDPSGWLAKK